MTALVSTFTTLPFNQLRRNRYFYIQYDGFYLVLFAGLVALMLATGFQGVAPEFHPLYLALVPLAIHFHITCNLVIHNCTHRNLPRSINRLIGELCGLVVLSRFASWEVIHQRHHKFSDDQEKDPHPVDPRGYWAFFFRAVFGIERQLQRTYFDLYGDTPETRAFERRRALVSYGTNVVLIAAWYLFLGPWAFVAFFVPAQILGWIHVMHFNWSTHNAMNRHGDYRPVNLDHGFFKIGNVLWFGIYFHANHHKKPNVFNPAKIDCGIPLTTPADYDLPPQGTPAIVADVSEEVEA